MRKEQPFDGKAQFSEYWMRTQYLDGFAPLNCIEAIVPVTNNVLFMACDHGRLRHERRKIGQEMVIYADWKQAVELFGAIQQKVRPVKLEFQSPSEGYFEMLLPETRRGLLEKHAREAGQGEGEG